jgi:WD40 repeat protein
MLVCFHTGPPFKFDHSLTKHTNFVNCVAFAPDGTFAVSVSSDKQIILYDGKTGEEVAVFPTAHVGSIYSCAWSPDSKQLLTASADKTCKLWDVAERTVVQTFTFAEKPALTDMQVACLWAGEQMISLSLSGDMNYLDAATPTAPRKIIPGHSCSVTALAISAQGAIVSSSYDGVVCLRKAGGQQNHLKGAGHGKRVAGLATSPSGQIYSIGWDDCVRIAEEGSGEYSQSISLTGQPSGIAVGVVDHGLAVISTTKGVVVLKDGAIAFQSPETMWTPTCIALSPDQTQVAVGGKEDNKIHVFTLNADNSLTELGEVVGHRGAITAVQYSPDGTLLAGADSNREVCLWNAATRAAVVQGKWVFHTTSITCLDFSPSGKVGAFPVLLVFMRVNVMFFRQQLVTGSLDETVNVWKVPEIGGEVSSERCVFSCKPRTHTEKSLLIILAPVVRRRSQGWFDGGQVP